jgi:hypothetical protein
MIPSTFVEIQFMFARKFRSDIITVMPGLVLPQPFKKILVVGPLYDKIDKLSRLSEMAFEYDWIIFNSGLCHPSDNIEKVKERIDKMRDFISKYNSAYVIGRYDYLMLTKTSNVEIERWVKGSYNVLLADFTSRGIVIVDGGIHNNVHTRADLFDNLEVSFTSNLDGKPWHEYYNGRVGYVISNNPLTDKHPKYYQHSMQLGNTYGPDNAVYAVEVDDISLKKTIVL